MSILSSCVWELFYCWSQGSAGGGENRITRTWLPAVEDVQRKAASRELTAHWRTPLTLQRYCLSTCLRILCANTSRLRNSFFPRAELCDLLTLNSTETLIYFQYLLYRYHLYISIKFAHPLYISVGHLRCELQPNSVLRGWTESGEAPRAPHKKFAQRLSPYVQVLCILCPNLSAPVMATMLLHTAEHSYHSNCVTSIWAILVCPVRDSSSPVFQSQPCRAETDYCVQSI